ncbi:MAG: ECF transporter S component [Candidatus Bathyarchaeota archaeon]|nr:ECF transporter S component [Candidatus Bathyarchaeota archaeon]
MKKESWRQPYSLIIVAMAVNAALYAAGSYLTAYIPSPWGIGQFRPAVVVPAFFSVIFGPWAGGVGAALGTLIVDSAKHGGIYPGSLLAAVPGNFIGFFVFGYLLRKKFNWARFITVTNVALILANVIVAFLYVFTYKLLYMQSSAFTQMSAEALIVLSLGLTVFWFVTMLPFVLLIVPALVAVTAKAFPSIVPEEVRINGMKRLPKRLLGASMIVPGIAMIAIGLTVTFASLSSYLPTNLAASYFPAATLTLIQILLYAGGATLTALGSIFIVKKSTH